jgi:hypothetical protein
MRKRRGMTSRGGSRFLFLMSTSAVTRRRRSSACLHKVLQKYTAGRGIDVHDGVVVLEQTLDLLGEVLQLDGVECAHVTQKVNDVTELGME